MMKTLLLSLAFILVSCAHKGDHHNFHKLQKISKADHRSEKNITRNTYRNPVETLTFFEVKPDMSVVEVSPGGGWYTEILGPYLKKEGSISFTIFSDESERSYAPRLNKKIRTLTSNKDLFGKVSFTTLETPNFMEPVAEDNSVDRVLTFRNVHNWMKDGKLKEVLASFYKALKPGGILGIVEHRTRSNKKQDPKAKSGYVREDFVINSAVNVGFEFIAKSEINANYNDKANYAKGVWTLPPSLRLKDKNRSKYLAIGESDRMTIKFRKPLK
jgi:predicted methyltransferase